MTKLDVDINALDKCIIHWKENEVAKTIGDTNIGSDGCALCSIYNLDWSNDCRGCPIKAKTGLYTCLGTPYDSVSNMMDLWFYSIDTGKWYAPIEQRFRRWKFNQAAKKFRKWLQALRLELVTHHG